MIEFESVTTKGGDKGFTSLFDGSRKRKDSQVIRLIGMIDSLNASFGIVRSDADIRQYDKNLIIHIQNDLYEIMAILSGYKKDFGKDKVEFLEKKQKLFMKFCKIPVQFINFGDNRQSAELNALRSHVRSVESFYCECENREPIILEYLNRLSDLVYVVSLVYEHKTKKKLSVRKNYGNHFKNWLISIIK